MNKIGRWILEKAFKILFLLGLLFYMFRSGKREGKNAVKTDKLKESNKLQQKAAKVRRDSDGISTDTKRDRLRQHSTKD